jgi:hypothetical protein
MLCHWLQMARRFGARPNPQLRADPNNKNVERAEVDPISEGWLDSLGAVALRKCSNNPNDIRFKDAEAARRDI